jgi:hypothetical protein
MIRGIRPGGRRMGDVINLALGLSIFALLFGLVRWLGQL